ncbi:recombinase family protein [Saccharopolyspora shandongensis]|uniref:recombinase family protein n=1 Tax=Saccharopolyspora shandongensis TaxID=418495 RepID=UPI003F4D83F5
MIDFLLNGSQGAVAEFERALMSERTRDGLAAARARGRTGGQKPELGLAPPCLIGVLGDFSYEPFRPPARGRLMLVLRLRPA